jgi:hypothetical protein
VVISSICQRLYLYFSEAQQITNRHPAKKRAKYKKKLHRDAALASDEQLFIGTVNDAARGPQTAKWSYTIWSIFCASLSSVNNLDEFDWVQTSVCVRFR